MYFIKIGVAYNPKQRTAMVKTGCPIEIYKTLHWKLENKFYAHEYEKQIHKIFSDQFTQCREWFYIPVTIPYKNIFNYIESLIK
jgi:hypothetical protein